MEFLVNDFYNEFVSAIHSKFFPNLKWLKDSEDGCRVAYSAELFNNGVISILKMERLVAKYCKASIEEIQEIRKQFLTVEDDV